MESESPADLRLVLQTYPCRQARRNCISCIHRQSRECTVHTVRRISQFAIARFEVHGEDGDGVNGLGKRALMHRIQVKTLAHSRSDSSADPREHAARPDQ